MSLKKIRFLVNVGVVLFLIGILVLVGRTGQ